MRNGSMNFSEQESVRLTETANLLLQTLVTTGSAAARGNPIQSCVPCQGQCINDLQSEVNGVTQRSSLGGGPRGEDQRLFSVHSGARRHEFCDGTELYEKGATTDQMGLPRESKNGRT